MSDMPSWIPPQAPTYTSNCAALSEAELIEHVMKAIYEVYCNDNQSLEKVARAAIAALRKAGR